MTRTGTRQENTRRAVRIDQRVWGGPNVNVVKPELPKRGAENAALKISGKRTSLEVLMERAFERQDARRRDL